MNPSEMGYKPEIGKRVLINPGEGNLLHQLRLLPNLISLSRLVLIIPILFLYSNPSTSAFWIVFSLLVLSYLSDYADGYFARKLSQQSMLGLILDPLADKIWTAVLICLLCLHRELPIWIAAIIIMRDVGILIINSRIYLRHRFVMPSNEFGRTYMVLMGLMIIGLTVGFKQLIWLGYFLVALALISWFKYLQNFYKVMRDFKQKIQEQAVAQASLPVDED